ncbi:thioesterase family protein [Bradyrhizobium septentrionale]|uniref:acyl-CoA thioesterase domain-containing protein n=1 Tax=Bradyrhizobium septentrionale TaxID=1404411 RepID=UPI001CD7D24C|nr:acyl-CoA thioesterase domain-containing protein [Bradyrhizobium septentrionale]UGY28025.1 thioesterase family protein [Bradyrhizobium septentrionale]
MAIFEPLATPHHWKPTALAAGPFAGLQGGAVASLLTAEVEAMADARNWGTAISASAWFLRPTPMAELRTQVTVLTEGGRVSVVDNTLWPAGEAQPTATVRVTLPRERAVEVPGLDGSAGDPVDPTAFPLRNLRAVHGHGRSWFMDTMEARVGGDVAWFRMHHDVTTGAGPLARVLGPADWTHGIARPVQNVVADPNPNLAVQLFRPPRGAWIGVRPEARWRPEAGLGVGRGYCSMWLARSAGVSMSVILVPFRKPHLLPRRVPRPVNPNYSVNCLWDHKNSPRTMLWSARLEMDDGRKRLYKVVIT